MDAQFQPKIVENMQAKILNEDIAWLAQLRENEQRAKAALLSMQRELEASPEYKRWANELTTTQEQLSKQDATVRRFALEIFTDTGDNHPSEAVTIKIIKEMRVKNDLALWNYVESSLPKAIIPRSLNMKLVEKAARALDEIAPIPGVEFDEKPQVSISKDLSAWLPIQPIESKP
jgi:hypothetical protein